jgi:hypothetical protein
MRTIPRMLALALFALAACSGDGDKPITRSPGAEPEADAEVTEPEADAEPPSEPDSDAGAPSSGPVPLSAWVDDMIDTRTDDDALPDTVQDKNVSDDMDSTPFTKYLN